MHFITRNNSYRKITNAKTLKATLFRSVLNYVLLCIWAFAALHQPQSYITTWYSKNFLVEPTNVLSARRTTYIQRMALVFFFNLNFTAECCVMFEKGIKVFTPLSLESASEVRLHCGHRSEYLVISLRIDEKNFWALSPRCWYIYMTYVFFICVSTTFEINLSFLHYGIIWLLFLKPYWTY